MSDVAWSDLAGNAWIGGVCAGVVWGAVFEWWVGAWNTSRNLIGSSVFGCRADWPLTSLILTMTRAPPSSSSYPLLMIISSTPAVSDEEPLQWRYQDNVDEYIEYLERWYGRIQANRYRGGDSCGGSRSVMISKETKMTTRTTGRGTIVSWLFALLFNCIT